MGSIRYRLKGLLTRLFKHIKFFLPEKSNYYFWCVIKPPRLSRLSKLTLDFIIIFNAVENKIYHSFNSAATIDVRSISKGGFRQQHSNCRNFAYSCQVKNILAYGLCGIMVRFSTHNPRGSWVRDQTLATIEDSILGQDVNTSYASFHPGA